jgi:hypothetical protein
MPTGKGDMSYLTLSDMKEQIRQHYVDRENMRIETATVKAQVAAEGPIHSLRPHTLVA